MAGGGRLHETAEAEVSSGQHVDVELQVWPAPPPPARPRAPCERCAAQKMSQWARYIALDIESVGLSMLNDNDLRAMLAGGSCASARVRRPG